MLLGAMHKDDVEAILRDTPLIAVIQPSSFGAPDAAAVARQQRRADHCAIAHFNLLGLQASTGVVNWSWLERIVAGLEAEQSTPETQLFATRLAVLTARIGLSQARARYEALWNDATRTLPFTWTGALDGSRLDSFVDPFGNLSVGRRALLEAAHVTYQQGEPAHGEQLRTQLGDGLSVVQQRQLDVYWQQYIATTS